MRKYYIDNLRWIAILLLFPYHTFMIYNSFGENFYVKGPNIPQTTVFIIATSPWFMPLLFALAGISSAFALQKISASQYLKERVYKLLIPLLFGILLLIPAQTFFAERFHNNYTGGYFQQYVLFFTKSTDLTGYTGGFTPGQLWFLIYLFIISIIATPIISINQKSKKKFSPNIISIGILIVMFIIPLAGTFVLNINGKSLGEYFAYFMLGYFILSDENVLQKLDKYRLLLLGISLFNMIIIILGWVGMLRTIPYIFFDIHSLFYGWTVILCLLGLGRHYLNFRNRYTDYLSKSSFSVYIFHQTWVIAIAYYLFRFTENTIFQIILIIFGSAALTFFTYEICKRIGITRFMFAIKR